MRVLLALLRARNLHEAARRLAVDRSTISRRVAALEEKLRAKLFVRTRDGLRPTAQAERLRALAERMELDAAALGRAAGGDETRAAGRVRVATTEALATWLVERGLLRLRQAHPDLRLEIYGDNRPLDLARGEADVALRVAAPRQPSLRARRIARMGVGLYGAPAYLEARGRPRTARALGGHDLLLPAGELGGLPEVKWLAARARVEIAFRSNSMSALIAAATAGLGLVPLPLGWGDRTAALERVLTLAVPERSLWLVTPAAPSSPAARVVAAEIAKLCKDAFG